MALQSFTCGILTLSDKGARGERQDTSGPLLCALLTAQGFTVTVYEILPDQEELIAAKLMDWADELRLDLIVTTGGTGVSPSDRTPEATRRVIEREIPGLSEAMRAASLRKTVQAVWSRGIAGLRWRTLIINLPGSARAAKENLEAVLPVLAHGIEKIQGSTADCGG
jgi:molybdopterin adenylyltransferase